MPTTAHRAAGASLAAALVAATTFAATAFAPAAAAAPGAGVAAAPPAALTTPAPPPPDPTPTPTVAPIPPLPPLPTPGRPVVTELGSDRATLTWAPSDGPVFRYSMQFLIDGAWQTWIAGPTNTLTVTGLTPATEYTVRVWAAPLAGAQYTVSAPSEPTTFRTLAVLPQLSCQVAVTVWSGGFLISITLTNPTTGPLATRPVTFTVSPTTRINQVWNARVTQSGQRVTAEPATWNSTVQPGASVSLGMLGTYTGQFEAPDDFELPGGGQCQVVVR